MHAALAGNSRVDFFQTLLYSASDGSALSSDSEARALVASMLPFLHLSYLWLCQQYDVRVALDAFLQGLWVTRIGRQTASFRDRLLPLHCELIFREKYIALLGPQR